MSRHTLKLRGGNVVVGWSDLEQGDVAAGRERGLFRPGVGYDLVQPVFQLYAEAMTGAEGEVRDPDKLDRYYRARDALGLVLEDESGSVVRTNTIHIADYSHRRGGRIELDVLIADPGYWERRTE